MHSCKDRKFLTGLVADTDIDTSLLGKSITDLQSNITITDDSVLSTDDKISGTLKYVTGYTGFSGDTALQSGNYLALHFELAEDTNNTVTVEIIGGTSGAVTLDNDGIWIGYIKNTNQKIKVIATAEGQPTVTKIYTLDGLTLETEA